jgi:hypothetical protein
MTNRAGTDRPIDYAVTPMLNGGHRAECHLCGWWVDVQLHPTATAVLRRHLADWHPGTPWRGQRREVRP